VFHSSSGGYTEDSGNVWGETLPYLRSVQSPESATSVPQFLTENSVTVEEFRRIALTAYPEMDLSMPPEAWFSNIVRSDTGRLVSVTLGGVELSATKLRLLFGLRSANIEWEIGETEISFTVKGYGHGVGLSQYGANEFARNGASFEDILRYYYQGASISAPPRL
jgi:stage II sporulation protein D